MPGSLNAHRWNAAGNTHDMRRIRARIQTTDRKDSAVGGLWVSRGLGWQPYTPQGVRVAALHTAGG